MKYLTEEKFIVNSNSKEAIKNYNDNYDRVFGPTRLSRCTCPHQDENEPLHDFDCPIYRERHPEP